MKGKHYRPSLLQFSGPGSLMGGGLAPARSLPEDAGALWHWICLLIAGVFLLCFSYSSLALAPQEGTPRILAALPSA